ncbi:MAG: fibronectin type III domain-containing protein, partial [Kiritimatiellae bacterium]|nr:fibronectin type III domain-containing protein [Kiritimatiellia bacterium]
SDPGDLEDDHVYRYRIRAFNDMGSYGEWTKPAAVRTRPVPPAPQGVVAESGLPRSVKVKWTMSPDEKVVGYVVERSDGDDGSWSKVAKISSRETVSLYDRDGASEDAITGKLKDGTAYLYRVTAVNTADAKSVPSEPARAVTKLAPKTPSGVVATKDVAGKIKVSWSRNPEPDIVEYWVEMQSMGGLMWRSLAKVKKDTCEAFEEGLGNGEVRSYRVKAVDANTHESEWSEVVEGSSRPLPPPPTALKAARDGGGYKLSFVPPREGMTAFKVYRSKLMGDELVKTVKTPEATVEAPPAGESADYVVTAVDECGLESEQSEKVTIGG